MFLSGFLFSFPKHKIASTRLHFWPRKNFRKVTQQTNILLFNSHNGHEQRHFWKPWRVMPQMNNPFFISYKLWTTTTTKTIVTKIHIFWSEIGSSRWRKSCSISIKGHWKKIVLTNLLCWDHGNWELRSSVPEKAGDERQLFTIEAFVGDLTLSQMHFIRKELIS